MLDFPNSIPGTRRTRANGEKFVSLILEESTLIRSCQVKALRLAYTLSVYSNPKHTSNFHKGQILRLHSVYICPFFRRENIIALLLSEITLLSSYQALESFAMKSAVLTLPYR